MKVKHKDIWTSTYNGVSIEIARWELAEDKIVWNYYLFIPFNQLPPTEQKLFNLKPKYFESGRLFYDYSSVPIVADLDWHGGITFYDKVFEEVYKFKWLRYFKVVGFKLGCDYIHLWDENINYSFDYVLLEAKHSVDRLHDYIPNIKLRCEYDGKFYKQEDGYFTEGGFFLSNNNKSKMNPELIKPITITK